MDSYFLFSTNHISLVMIFLRDNNYLEDSKLTHQAKNLPAMQETQDMRVRFLVQKDPLKEEMATHSSILLWENL